MRLHSKKWRVPNNPQCWLWRNWHNVTCQKAVWFDPLDHGRPYRTKNPNRYGIWYVVRIFGPRFHGPVRGTDFGPDSNLVRYVVRISVRIFFSVRYVVRTKISKNWKNKGFIPNFHKNEKYPYGPYRRNFEHFMIFGPDFNIICKFDLIQNFCFFFNIFEIRTKIRTGTDFRTEFRTKYRTTFWPIKISYQKSVPRTVPLRTDGTAVHALDPITETSIKAQTCFYWGTKLNLR